VIRPFICRRRTAARGRCAVCRTVAAWAQTLPAPSASSSLGPLGGRAADHRSTTPEDPLTTTRLSAALTTTSPTTLAWRSRPRSARRDAEPYNEPVAHDPNRGRPRRPTCRSPSCSRSTHPVLQISMPTRDTAAVCCTSVSGSGRCATRRADHRVAAYHSRLPFPDDPPAPPRRTGHRFDAWTRSASPRGDRTPSIDLRAKAPGMLSTPDHRGTSRRCRPRFVPPVIRATPTPSSYGWVWPKR